jgi:hypothetical protein
MAFILKFLFVLVLMIGVDVCWTMYFISISKRHAIPAGLWSGAIMAFGSLATISYVDDHRFLIAVIIGSFIGTSGTVYFNQHKKQKDEN